MNRGVGRFILPAMRIRCLSLMLFVPAVVAAQAPSSALAQASAVTQQVWQTQDSGTTAGLRGIFSVDGKVAWASGTEGTVLKTVDGGAHWQKCAVPDAATDGATLDFRGLHAWDADTAIVMASGPGEKSRLYKTTDGCKTWNLILKNKDKHGFWDTLYFDRGRWSWLLGDPVNGEFSLFASNDAGKSWTRQHNKGLRVKAGTQGAFAASNSSLVMAGGNLAFGSGGSAGALLHSRSELVEICLDDCSPQEMNLDGRKDKWYQQKIPLGENTDSSGVFSLAYRDSHRPDTEVFFKGGGGTNITNWQFIAVGGDYTKPNESAGTAAWSDDSGRTWTASATPPHGYRSSVQWSEALKLWITAGANGSDISRDDGRTWQPLDDGNWNALSLPFVVGPKGRIARLNPAAISATTAAAGQK